MKFAPPSCVAVEAARRIKAAGDADVAYCVQYMIHAAGVLVSVSLAYTTARKSMSGRETLGTKYT